MFYVHGHSQSVGVIRFDRFIHLSRDGAAGRQKALATDPDNLDALVAQLFALPPFGEFPEGGRRLERLRNSPGRGDGKKYVGWYMRTLGMVEESVIAAQAAYELDLLDAMTINQLALAKLAAGHLDKAAPLYAK